MKRPKVFGNRGARSWRGVDLPAEGSGPWHIKQCIEVPVSWSPALWPALYFHGDPQRLPLTPTQWDVLAAELGEDSDDWVGHSVFLYPEPGVFRGGPKDGQRYVSIRVQVVDAAAEAADRPRPVAVTANGLDHDGAADAPAGDRDD